MQRYNYSIRQCEDVPAGTTFARAYRRKQGGSPGYEAAIEWVGQYRDVEEARAACHALMRDGDKLTVSPYVDRIGA